MANRLVFVASILLTMLVGEKRQLARNEQQTNDVLFVDLMTRANAARHHTTSYQTLGQNLVFRRGEQLELELHFRFPYNKTSDRVRLELGLGSNPQLSDSTLSYTPLLEHSLADSPLNWTARISSISGKRVAASFRVPANAPIGLWHFKVSSKLAGTREVQTYAFRKPIFIIFNVVGRAPGARPTTSTWRATTRATSTS